MKKLLSAILTICLLLSCTAPAFAAVFPDLEPRHAWAEPAIEYMVSKGIINGYEDDTFRPDRTVTRAEFIKMLDETFGLTATAAIPFTDVPADQWYAPYVKKAVAQGYLLNYGSLLNPNGALSRQEAAALLVRYLKPDESLKASTTTFTDYSSIKVAYRDYVLLAAGIGLINGYEDDTFRPDKPLNRAEALAILYRAAGMICKENVMETEAGAGDKNAVIVKSGVTVTGANLPGRVIISEGVSGGTVTLSECLIGELVVRGTPTVILSGCTVDSLIVDCSTKGKTSALSMLSGTTVKSMTLRTSADISTASRTTLTKLTVEEGAIRSTVSGSGTFTNAVINASGFVSDKLPTTYTLGRGISATFADKVYNSGSTPSATDTGFTVQPSVYASSTYNYLTLTPVAGGKVYYYYTNMETAPTADLFDSYYAVAGSRSSFDVTANRAVDTQIGAISAVNGYSHLVVRFSDSLGNKYQPVVLSNRASGAFTLAPTVSTTGSYQYLTFTPAINGTVFYYYTSSSAVPSADSFTDTYISAATSYKNYIDITAGKAVNQSTFAAASVAAYPYVAIMVMDSDNKEYPPIVIATGGSSSTLTATGFTEEPYCTTTGSSVTLGLTASFSGTVEYYFSSSSSAPTAGMFDTVKSLTPITMSGSIPVTAGASSRTPLLNVVSTTTYPYLIVRLKSTSGATYTPVAVPINSSIGGNTGTPGAAGSGFVISPSVSYAAGKYTLTFQTLGSGTLYYYLTNNPTAPGSTFMGNYDMTTSDKLSVKLGGAITATGTTQTVATILSTGLSDDYKYMAIMYRQGTTAYTPMVVSVPFAEEVVNQNTGILVGPSYTVYQMGTGLDSASQHQVEFSATFTGNVWYYYTDENTIPKPADVIDAVVMGGEGIGERGKESIVANQKKQISVYFDGVAPKYIVLMLEDTQSNYYKPVLVSSSGLTTSSGITTGFNERNTSVTTTSGIPMLEYITMESGKVYYYFTNNGSTVADMWEFFSNSTTRGYYSAAAEGVKGVVNLPVGKGSAYLTTTKSVAGYSHVVLLFQRSAGETGGYCKPLVLALNGTAGGNNFGGTTTTGFSDTPYLLGNSVYFVPSAAGTVYYGFTQTNSSADLYGSLGALGALGGLGGVGGLGSSPASIAGYIATMNHGSSMPVANAGVAQAIYIAPSYFTQFKYVALWTVTAGGQMSTPVFVSLGNASGGLGNLGSGNGFVVAPQYNSLLKQISFTSAVAGNVYYFYTNSTVNYNTHATFTTAFYQALENSSGIAGNQPVTAGQAGSISVTVNNVMNTYKYVWVYMFTGDGSYTPVRIQLY